MAEIEEESNDYTIESLVEGKKKMPKPSPNKPWPTTLLEVKKEMIKRRMTKKEQRDKALHEAKAVVNAITRESRG